MIPDPVPLLTAGADKPNLAHPSNIVQSGDSGLLVAPENPTALAQTLELMMSAPKARHTMGKRARTISNRLDVARVLDRWFTLISDCRKL